MSTPFEQFHEGKRRAAILNNASMLAYKLTEHLADIEKAKKDHSTVEDITTQLIEELSDYSIQTLSQQLEDEFGISA